GNPSVVGKQQTMASLSPKPITRGARFIERLISDHLEKLPDSRQLDHLNRDDSSVTRLRNPPDDSCRLPPV
ncbi:MAG: hypothetical protein ACPHL6_11405, partial [Rubripirellula sp.]